MEGVIHLTQSIGKLTKAEVLRRIEVLAGAVSTGTPVALEREEVLEALRAVYKTYKAYA